MQLLVPSGENLLFAQETLRQALLGELDPAEQRRARQVLAQQLMTSDSTVERLQAGVHLMAAGDPAGAALVTREALHIIQYEFDKLQAAAGQLEQALALFRASGKSAHAQLPLLALMVITGYHVDRRFLREYAPEAMRELQRLFGVDLARKLRPRLGAKLSLLAGLSHAAWKLEQQRRADPCVPPFTRSLSLLFACSAIVTGVSLELFDAEAAEANARVLEPFAALGRDHLGGLIAEFVACLAASARDRTTEACERWQLLLARLESAKPIRGSSPILVEAIRCGTLLAMGAHESYGDGDGALRRADALERTGWRVNLISAEQLRTTYYGARGHVRQYAQHRVRLEQLAIAYGTIWQLESASAGASSMIAFLLHDALALKSECEHVERVAADQPGLTRLVQEMRGMYLLLRDLPADALPLLATCMREPPFSRQGWTRAHGFLARAYNRLGQHELAHAACTRALAQIDPRDLQFPLLTLITTTELAIAEAGCGRFDVAEQQWAELVDERSRHDNALTLALCYEAGVEIAVVSGDLTSAQNRFALLCSLYGTMNAPTLMQHSAQLAKRLNELANPTTVRSLRPSMLMPANDIDVQPAAASVSAHEETMSETISTDEPRQKETKRRS